MESWYFRLPANFYCVGEEALAKFAFRCPKYEGLQLYNHKFYKKWREPQMLFSVVFLNIWKNYYFLYIFVWPIVTSVWEYKFSISRFGWLNKFFNKDFPTCLITTYNTNPFKWNHFSVTYLRRKCLLLLCRVATSSGMLALIRNLRNFAKKLGKCQKNCWVLVMSGKYQEFSMICWLEIFHILCFAFCLECIIW